MDSVPSDAPQCPHCKHELDARTVWLTRRDRGTIPIPSVLSRHWVSFCIILLGVGLTAFTYFASEGQSMTLYWGLIGIGCIKFVKVLLMRSDED